MNKVLKLILSSVIGKTMTNCSPSREELRRNL